MDKRAFVDSLAKQAEEAAGQKNLKELYSITRKKASQVCFIVNSSTCTVHAYRELKLRYSQTLGAYS